MRLFFKSSGLLRASKENYIQSIGNGLWSNYNVETAEEPSSAEDPSLAEPPARVLLLGANWISPELLLKLDHSSWGRANPAATRSVISKGAIPYGENLIIFLKRLNWNTYGHLGVNILCEENIWTLRNVQPREYNQGNGIEHSWLHDNFDGWPEPVVILGPERHFLNVHNADDDEGRRRETRCNRHAEIGCAQGHEFRWFLGNRECFFRCRRYDLVWDNKSCQY